MQMNKLALIDIDGTLVSLTDFDETKAKVPEYINYWNKQTMNAEVLYEGVKQLKRLYALGYVLIVVTARDTTCKPFTVKKLKEMGVYHMITGVWHRPVAMNGLEPSDVKNVLIPRIENRYKNKFVVAMEDSNHAIMKKHNIVVIDANTYNKGEK
jgi:3-deoxy-D-manno-octulosonate 8-phosphate phosphatase KdsC-like HAD superfamily phosphatase